MIILNVEGQECNECGWVFQECFAFFVFDYNFINFQNCFVMFVTKLIFYCNFVLALRRPSLERQTTLYDDSSYGDNIMYQNQSVTQVSYVDTRCVYFRRTQINNGN